MKNKDFYFLQYNKISWKNQEKTKLNSFINNFIIQNIILKHKKDSVAVFDIGFGVGFFIKMLIGAFSGHNRNLFIEGCEPSRVNYDYFYHKTKNKKFGRGVSINVYNESFQKTKSASKFDFITAIYVFPHFLSEDLENVVKKIHTMLKDDGKFILILANEKYLERKLSTEQDLFIETKNINYKGGRYKEILHYTEIPKIGKVVDYNREEAYYLDLFKNNHFTLIRKENLDDNGFICTLFVFKKKVAQKSRH